MTVTIGNMQKKDFNQKLSLTINKHKMKKLMIIATLITGIAILTAFRPANNAEPTKIDSIAATDFCDGWEDGYCEGWKDVKGQYAFCPLTPFCPFPELGENSYRGGYNRGFKAGMREANNDETGF